MCECKTPLAVAAAEVPPRTKPSNYPEPFFSRMARREKRPLGDLFSLENFGVNLTTLEPGGETALMPARGFNSLPQNQLRRAAHTCSPQTAVSQKKYQNDVRISAL